MSTNRKPGGKKSIVWDIFEKTLDGKCRCKLCGKNFKIFSNTSNYRDHIKRIHPLECDLFNKNSKKTEEKEENKPSQSIVQCVVNNLTDVDLCRSASPPLKRSKKQLKLFADRIELSDLEKSKINRSLVEMITGDLQPLSIVEDSGFIQYSKNLNPLYKPPCRKVLSQKLLPDLYKNTYTKLFSDLQNVEHVSVTADMWSSDNMKSLVTVTCHYIKNFELKSAVLATREFREGHTGENIGNTLLKIFNEWNIHDKITSVVADNASNIKKAITTVLKKRHHPCVAHTLNLAVSDAIKENLELGELLIKCRSIVRHFKQSTTASEKLREKQETMQKTVLKVKQDTPTRWNSILIMIERLIALKSPLSAAISDLPNAPANFVPTEWQVLSDCMIILKPVELMTTELSGEKYVTASLIIPLVRGIQKSLSNKKPETDIGKKLQQSLIKMISERLAVLENDKVISKATILDPRFKKLGFGIESTADSAQKLITDELVEINSSITQMSTSADAESSEIQQGTSETNDLWAFFDNKVSERKTTFSSSSTAIVTVKTYLELPTLDRKFKTPLKFWEKNQGSLGELHRLACKYLCIPATSVPSERVFSKTGLIMNVRRNRLDPKKADQIIFLNSNINLFE